MTCPIVPWFVPELDGSLKDLILENGQLKRFSSRDSIHKEDTSAHHFRFVLKGAVGQATVNYELNKPIAMNNYGSGSLIGTLNFFSQETIYRHWIALENKTEVVSVSHETLREQILESSPLVIELASYIEKLNKSELLGLVALSTLSLEQRFWLFVASGFYRNKIEIPSTADFVEIPFRFTRRTLCEVIYASPTVLDHLLAKLHQEGSLKLENNRRYVVASRLQAPSHWLLTH